MWVTPAGPRSRPDAAVLGGGERVDDVAREAVGLEIMSDRSGRGIDAIEALLGADPDRPRAGPRLLPRDRPDDVVRQSIRGGPVRDLAVPQPPRQAAAEQADPERALAIDGRGERRVDREPLATPDEPPEPSVARRQALDRGHEHAAEIVDRQPSDLARIRKALVVAFEALRAPREEIEPLDRPDPEAALAVRPDVVQGLVGRQPSGPPELDSPAGLLAEEQAAAREIHDAARVRVHRADRTAAHRIGLLVELEPIRASDVEAPVGADEQRARRVRGDTLVRNREDAEALLLVEDREALVAVAREARRGRDVEPAVDGLMNLKDPQPRQAVAMAELAETAPVVAEQAVVGSDPDEADAVLDHALDREVLEAVFLREAAELEAAFERRAASLVGRERGGDRGERGHETHRRYSEDFAHAKKTEPTESRSHYRGAPWPLRERSAPRGSGRSDSSDSSGSRGAALRPRRVRLRRRRPARAR